MANFSFFNFVDLGEGLVENATTLHLRSQAAQEVVAGDQVIVGGWTVAPDSTYTVQEVYSARDSDMVVVVVDVAMPVGAVGGTGSVRHKGLSRIPDLASKVLQCSTVANVRAEAYVFCYTIVLPSFLVFRCFCHSLIHLLLPSCII
jgi:hypothetical protein